jgi:HlyD family secretion protein
MMRRAVVALGTLAVLVAAALAVSRLGGSATGVTADASAEVPTTVAARGTIRLDVRLKGELRASRQQTLSAPAVGGTTLRVLKMLDTGARVQEGDLLVEFDPGDQLFALEQAESELAEVEQEIRKRKADIAAQQAADGLTLLTAEFDVRRAELDARADADLIGANEYKIRQVTLEEARRRLDQVKQDRDARTVTSQASLQVLEERLTRARLSANQAREAMDNLTLTAPIDGLVSVRENRDGLMMIYSGMSLPTYTVGDDVRAGRPVVDVLDVGTMEIRADVNEEERVNLRTGQGAIVRADSVPGAEYEAEVVGVSGLGRANYREGPLRQFEVSFELARPDDLLRPGASVDLVVEGDAVENVLLLPRQTVFEEDGQSVVYVPAAGAGSRYEARPVTVLHRSETHVAIEGIEDGTEVALVHPTSVRATVSKPEAAVSGPIGGGP